jgi:type II secretory ATPase GspE/PulE/Tfp pilus assembly ATPase PilB-like protein
MQQFRLIMREAGVTREMGGELTQAVSETDFMLRKALDLGASDIHLQPERNRLLVRYRIDGVMHDVGQSSLDIMPNVLARLKLAAGMHIDERREPQDGRLDMEYGSRKLSARMSVLPGLNGEKVVMRILDPMGAKVELEKLGMPPDVAKQWAGSIQSSYGMVLVTGPTGSGKTSTLYASLNKLDREKRNIVTVEDPVEYEFSDHILQVQVTEKMTFPRVMRSFLRQDPDVMMVGEVRDLETARVAVQAALTGHMILSTLHTNSAASAVTRLLDMGIEPFLITSTVKAVLAQRLVRRLCEVCREPYTPAAPIEARDEDGEARTLQVDRLYHAKGCPACGGTGFKGRIALVVDAPIAKLVLERAEARDIAEAAVAGAMRTMFDDGLIKARDGLTTLEEVLRVTGEA